MICIMWKPNDYADKLIYSFKCSGDSKCQRASCLDVKYVYIFTYLLIFAVRFQYWHEPFEKEIISLFFICQTSIFIFRFEPKFTERLIGL